MTIRSPAIFQADLFDYEHRVTNNLTNHFSDKILQKKKIDYASVLKKKNKKNQEMPVFYWNIKKGKLLKPKGYYQGNFIILVNRKTASASENFVSFARSIKNCITIGENTSGSLNFTHHRYYVLPNSGIVLKLPSELNIIEGFQEGTGFYPDYWLDSNKPVEEIIKWIKNPATYVFNL